MNNATCPKCGGQGATICHHNTGPNSAGHYWAEETCRLCQGAGTVSDAVLAQVSEGQRLQARRRARGESILGAARRMGITTAAVSQVEQGYIPRSTVTGYTD